MPADFTVVDHRRLWRAALACKLPFRCDGSRTRAIADAAGVTFEVAEELRSSAPVLHDGRGTWAGRVREATLLRRMMAQAAELHDDIGRGATIDETLAELEKLREVAAGTSAGVLAGPEALAAA